MCVDLLNFFFLKKNVPSGPKFSSEVTNVNIFFSLLFLQIVFRFLAIYKCTAALDLQLTAPRPKEYLLVIFKLYGFVFHSSKIGFTVSMCELKTNILCFL